MDTLSTIPGADSVTARARRARLGWHRFGDVAVEMPSHMYAHVRGGHVISFGIEPVGDAIVALDGTVTRALDGAAGHLDRVRVAAAGAAGGLAAAALAAAGAVALRRSRRR